MMTRVPLRGRRAAFAVGDHIAAAATAIAVSLVVRVTVSPGMDMVLAMLAGIALGTLVHIVIGVALIPLLGMFESMIPGMLIGMHGGMLFGMRRSMQDLALRDEIITAIIFGVTVAAWVTFQDRLLRQRTTGALAAREGYPDES